MPKTSISWTKFTWNPITGCTQISAGCKNCYAKSIFKRLTGIGSKNYQHPFSEVRCHPERLDEVAHWRKPRTIFVCSMADLFHEDVPIDFIWKLFNVIIEHPQHTFQILTKRIDRAQEVISDMLVSSWKDRLPDNVWLGVSVENQKAADERIPFLLQTPAAVRFLSVEPMLGEIGIEPYLKHPDYEDGNKLDQVIIGVESGGKRRKTKEVPCPKCHCMGTQNVIEYCSRCNGYGMIHESQLWIENIARQTTDAGALVFIKQMEINGKVEKNMTKFPKHLQIQEKPEAV